MSYVVQWWDVLFVKGMHFSSKNARLLNFGNHWVDQLPSILSNLLLELVRCYHLLISLLLSVL